MKRKVVSLFLTAAMLLTGLVGCGSASSTSTGTGASASTESTSEKSAEELTGIDAIIAEAETMTLEELAQKAIEESNGKTFYGVGNSSRGKSALPVFIEYLQSIDSSYNMEFEWHE